MFPEALAHEQFVALHSAYAKACIELGIDPHEPGRREQLAALMFTLAKDGETNPDVIRAHAVHRMQPPAAGLFHAI
jgi:hypothetical protein